MRCLKSTRCFVQRQTVNHAIFAASRRMRSHICRNAWCLHVQTCSQWRYLVQVLPGFLARLPLRHLDLGNCRHLNLAVIPTMTQLQVLSLSATGLAEHRDSGAPLPAAVAIRMHLPDLSKLTNLTALNLSDNRLTRVPPVLAKLKQLHYLDLSCNQELQVNHRLGAVYCSVCKLHFVAVV